MNKPLIEKRVCESALCGRVCMFLCMLLLTVLVDFILIIYKEIFMADFNYF